MTIGAARFAGVRMTIAGARFAPQDDKRHTPLSFPSYMRIVSFLPAATEIAHALGAGPDLVGRSHECDFPADVSRLPIVSRPALSLDGLTQSEINEAVTAQMRSG